MFGSVKKLLYTCARSIINISILFRMNINKHISQKKIYFCLYVKIKYIFVVLQ